MKRPSKTCFQALFASFVITVIFPFPLLASSDHSVWRAGASSAVITPTEPMWMTGYAHRNKPSEGKVHDLWAKALALQDGSGTRLVILTTDLLGIPRQLRLRVEEKAGRLFQLKPEELLLSASHTHCGPELGLLRGLTWNLPAERTQRFAAYVDYLETTLLKLIESSLNQLSPASLSYTHGRAGFAMNRRVMKEHGFVISPNPDGPVDHDVPVLQVHDQDDQLRALLFGYACHNTTLSFYHLCGDYAGFAQAYLEEAHPDTMALFVAGCAGDQNPYPRRSLDLARQHGRALANAVEAAIEADAKPVRGSLRPLLEEVTLEFQEPPGRDELKERLRSKDQWERIHADMLLRELDRRGQLPTSCPYPIQVVQFGNDLTLVALAGEVVVDYSLRLKAELRGSRIWTAAYCNDVMGYISTANILREGGYEPVGSTKFYGLPGPFAESIEEVIVGKVHDMVEKARESAGKLARLRQ